MTLTKIVNNSDQELSVPLLGLVFAPRQQLDDVDLTDDEVAALPAVLLVVAAPAPPATPTPEAVAPLDPPTPTEAVAPPVTTEETAT